MKTRDKNLLGKTINNSTNKNFSIEKIKTNVFRASENGESHLKICKWSYEKVHQRLIEIHFNLIFMSFKMILGQTRCCDTDRDRGQQQK